MKLEDYPVLKKTLELVKDEIDYFKDKPKHLAGMIRLGKIVYYVEEPDLWKPDMMGPHPFPIRKFVREISEGLTEAEIEYIERACDNTPFAYTSIPWISDNPGHYWSVDVPEEFRTTDGKRTKDEMIAFINSDTNYLQSTFPAFDDARLLFYLNMHTFRQDEEGKVSFGSPHFPEPSFEGYTFVLDEIEDISRPILEIIEKDSELKGRIENYDMGDTVMRGYVLSGDFNRTRKAFDAVKERGSSEYYNRVEEVTSPDVRFNFLQGLRSAILGEDED